MNKYFKTNNEDFGYGEPVILVNKEHKVYRNKFGRIKVLQDDEVVELKLVEA